MFKCYFAPLLKPFEACFEVWVRVSLMSEILMDIEPYRYARLRTGEVHPSAGSPVPAAPAQPGEMGDPIRFAPEAGRRDGEHNRPRMVSRMHEWMVTYTSFYASSRVVHLAFI
jgi:hypothetical protein